MARALPEDYARRISMAALVPRLPEVERATVADEVLRLLDVEPDSLDIRIAALDRLASAVSTDAVADACRHLIADLNQRSLARSDAYETFCDLLAHLPIDLIETVLRFSDELLPDRRCQIVRALAPRLTDDLLRNQLAAVEATAAHIAVELTERWRALVALATHLGDEDDDLRHRIQGVVLDEIVERRSWYASAPVLVELIPLSPRSLRDRAVATAVQLCFSEHELENVESLFHVLGERDLEFAFAQLSRIRSSADQARAFVALLRRAGRLTDVSTVFRDVDVLDAWPTGRPRTELLDLVAASAWWIHRQGGPRAVADALAAVVDVARWWR